ncbi:murein hydrolase activator EnvC family protein [Longimicrobium sp.]|uniref:murein hydrolase activator EnvC family protein n=1 Tax=Longimicrobium sp. TaxID=2029185 RepID=UPI002D0342E6|nr:peptidoglycan DD-metalloendopeptidase family protein [Longimicrobium sp.]HSU16228.1 peptidoglycan DD-metalloendopeptidase family protein [Longimicrobium sp.]
MRRRVRTFAAAGLALALPLAAIAQQGGRTRPAAQQLTESQRRLQEIRAERSQLRGELSGIRSRVHDVTSEIRNIQRQREVSAALLRELSFQMGETQRKIEETTEELLRTQDELAQKKALLNRRLRDIYKRGPMQTEEALLTANSFADLLNRYKYLYLVARRDRTLVGDVGELQHQLELREQELRRSYTDLTYLQNERETENAQLGNMAAQRTSTLSSLRSHERTTVQRIDELLRDERRLTSLMATLEARRREDERRERDRLAAAERDRVAARAAGRPAPATPTPVAPRAAPTMTTSSMGNLGWPVQGNVVYRFGRALQTNGTAIRYNGIGIGAAAGSPVRAVEGGKVEMAAPFEGYGPTVVISHGGGYYSLYLYLKDIQVQPGATVAKGQVVGTVGGEGTPEGAHVEFQIRTPGGEAVDPLAWLRGR